MTDIGLGVGYWHPRTQFRLHAEKRNTVITTEKGSHLRPVVDVDVKAGVVPDPRARQLLSFDVDVLEKLELQFTFDDRGLLESLNSESGRDITPVITLVGKVVGLAALAAMVMAPDEEEEQEAEQSLEYQWAQAHPTMARLLGGLEERVETLLGQVVDVSTAPKEVVGLGDALDILQTYLASISQLRREWISAQGNLLVECEWKWSPADLVRKPGVELPATLVDPEVPAAMREAFEMGLLLAICDDNRAHDPTDQGDGSASVDTVVLRASRPAQIGVYVLGEEGVWRLDRDSVLDLDVLDEFSPSHALSLDGTWLRSKKFALAYHPDKSLKTFGLASTSSAGSIVTSIGGAVDSASASAKAWLERPSTAARELAKAKTQLDLAKTASEMEVLAATRSRAAEVALLEQENKIRDARQ